MEPQSLEAKEETLKNLIKERSPLAVAYSGGVDSTYLADVVHEVLGDRMCCLLADSPAVPRADLEEARGIAGQRGWALVVVLTPEFSDERYLRNDDRRCYHCRKIVFDLLLCAARGKGMAALAYGANADDSLDATRVGHEAAVELGVISPLQEAGLTKAEVRRLSERRGLPTADKPSFACLSTRFPKGIRLSEEAVGRVERMEAGLKGLGFRQYRARHHGEVCRIEVEQADLARAVDPEVREAIVQAASECGYRHVALDLAGYRTGSTA